MHMLDIHSVVAGYGEKQVLHGISLKINASEIVGLVGPNGSGKSTVLKSIFGMVKVTAGEILYKGELIQNRKPSLNAAGGICYIPQGSKVFDKLTVQENLEMGGVLIQKRSELNDRVASMYEQFPKLRQYRNTLAGRLSGGERQMVGVCRGLIMHPDMMLIDEPSIGLAPVLVQQTMELIRIICEKFRTTVLIVEQNVPAMLKIVDRVYLLSTGKVIHEETAVDNDTERRLRTLFLK
jgi:ABC-type branched-subunit amino acid transport system ATPase component